MKTNIPETFKALLVEETDSGFIRSVKILPFDFLPAHEVIIRVEFSSLNYKDSLSWNGNKGVTKKFPHIPGIDASGTVVSDTTGIFSSGEKVLVTGYDLGQNTPGGFGEYIRVPAEWVISLPQEVSTFQAMCFGTAGFTGVYALHHIENAGIKPSDGTVVVTGATGGVGSFAVSFLAESGYRVAAVTGKMEKADFLKKLGASEILSREEFLNVPERPLLSAGWAAAVDTVGGSYLDVLVRGCAHNGVVACCGNIGGHQVSTSIYPFILRGVGLQGVDSAICLRPRREKNWKRIFDNFIPVLEKNSFTVVSKENVKQEVEAISRGKQAGRVVLEHETA